jgi:flagella basal body P-ring formation protein FlgA
VFVTVAALLVAPPVFAGTPVMLNPELVDTTGHVTLGELFDDAGPARDVVVADRAGRTVVLDADAVQAFARRYGLDWSNPQGIRRLIVRSDEGPAAQPRNVEALTYARSLAAGEILQPSDIVWSKVAAAAGDAAPSADSVIGLAERRPVREGDPVMSHDVTAPIVIKAGDTVAVTYADDGMILTMTGRAMTTAAAGDTLNVQNTTSKKLIEVVASGPDQAVVGPEADRLKAARPTTQIALR